MAKQGRSFTLQTMTAADIPICAYIAGLSLKDDRHTQLKAQSATNPYDHETVMKRGLSYWLSQAPGAVEKTIAVDTSTQKALGWVVWGFRGFESQTADTPRREKERRDLAKDHSCKGADPVQAKSEPAESHVFTSARERLETHTGANFAVWEKRLMPPGTKCMYICSIAVHPDYQGRGIGSALLREGTDRADAENVFCWVHASEAGAPVFARHGFREIGRLEVDLDHWNSDEVVPPKGPEAKWGKYVFRYMRRPPLGSQAD